MKSQPDRRRSQTPAVVVGAGLNGLGVVRSLGSAGVPLVLVDRNSRAPAMRSRYVRKHVVYGSGTNEIIETLERIADGYPDQRPVLFLTQEHAVTAVATHHQRLAERYRLTLPAADIVEPLMHKDGVRRLAEAAGARIPRSVCVRTEADIDLVGGLDLPLVIKPSVRDAGYGKTFQRAYRVESHEEAYALLRQMIGVLADLVVQEWIEGSDSDIYFCLQYLPHDGSTPISFVGRKIRSWPPYIGGTACCTAAPEASELIARTTAFFQNAGMTGLAGLEYKRHAKTGEYIMVEPTVGRTDHQEEVATLNGVNIPYAAYCNVLGFDSAPLRSVSPARVWRDRESDIRSVAAGPEGMARMPEEARVVNASWRASDPMPALGLLVWHVAARLRRQAAAWIG